MSRTTKCAIGLSLLAGAALLMGAWSDPPQNFYRQHNLVSDGSVPADRTDPNLVNAWGLAFNPTGVWWVVDNGTGLSTLYDGAGAINSLVVAVAVPEGASAPSAPTGIVFSGGTGFVITDGANSAPARFIFSSEDGTIAAWAPTVPLPPPSTQARIVYTSPTGAIYKGLAIGNNGSGDFLYATDFHNARIDVLSSTFQLTTLDGSFQDPNLPAHFAPFGIRNINGSLYVTFARQDEDAEDDVTGAGLGFVDVFDLNGHLQRRLISRGPLNAPWGLALAPADFGRFSNALLVGNFGNGRINAFNPTTGAFLGHLLSPRGGPISIDGLWALGFGNGAGAGPTNTLFFTAGPGDEEHGLFGSITAASPGRPHD